MHKMYEPIMWDAVEAEIQYLKWETVYDHHAEHLDPGM